MLTGQLVAAVREVKPAGILFSHSIGFGQIYKLVDAQHASYPDVKTA
jgi:hypothetical protein